jgi:protein SCO1/2
MDKNKLFPSMIIWLTILSIVLLMIGIFLVKQIAPNKNQLPILGQLPDFHFTESGGQPFGLSELKGKINVVDFMFTSCPMICPVMTAKMAKLYSDFAIDTNVRFISITVDPQTDSLPVLRAYAIDHAITDNRWVFLRGPIEDVITLSEKGFMLSADRLPGGHSTRFILVDNQGAIRGYYDSGDDLSLFQLADDLRYLSKLKK